MEVELEDLSAEVVEVYLALWHWDQAIQHENTIFRYRNHKPIYHLHRLDYLYL